MQNLPLFFLVRNYVSNPFWKTLTLFLLNINIRPFIFQEKSEKKTTGYYLSLQRTIIFLGVVWGGMLRVVTV